MIHGVIHQVSENHGGRAASMTAPSQSAQTTLLSSSYTEKLANNLSFIETHGTGTKLGDPIEVDSLKLFEKQMLTNNHHDTIYLGALKQNIGHLEASAGFASLLKVLLQIKNSKLAPNRQISPLNHLIKFNNSRFGFLGDPLSWAANGEEIVAGISSFGFDECGICIVGRSTAF